MVKKGKGRKNNLETIEELVEEVDTAGELFKKECGDILDECDKVPSDEENVESDPQQNKRDELLRLAEDGEISKSVSYIKKASHKVINKLHTEYERKRMKKANEFLTDLLISKFSSTLGGLDAIEEPEVLEDELRRDELLKRDVYFLVEKVSPYIPLMGILSGGVTTVRHIYKHKTKVDNVVTNESS